jgi:tetratricopeptide (TPR) repeat protein
MKWSLHLPRKSWGLASLATRLSLTNERSDRWPTLSDQPVPPFPDGRFGATTESPPAWYQEARRHIQRHAWGHAQRALEQAPPDEPDHPAKQDLVSVRKIRRAIRRTSRWPSDVDAHLDLGQAYFDLDLPDEALAEFNLVQNLAPQRHEGYVLAALEYVYRGQYSQAATVWLRARAANPQLPELEQFLGSLPSK